jgi:uncharacterized protein
MTIRELLQTKREAILALAAQYGAANIRIFGSVARNEAGPSSDVDFLIDLERDWSLFDRISLIQDLEDLLGREVDVVTAKNLRPAFKDRIFQEAIPL